MFVAEVKGRHLLQLRGRMGRVYIGTVSRCLEGDFGERHAGNADENKCNTSIDDVIRSRRFLEGFDRYTVSVIERPLGFELWIVWVVDGFKTAPRVPSYHDMSLHILAPGTSSLSRRKCHDVERCDQRQYYDNLPVYLQIIPIRTHRVEP
jgi:hypothetical protein